MSDPVPDPRNPRPSRLTDKVSDHVDSGLPGVPIDGRAPGWLPDTVTSEKGDRTHLFPKEALGSSDSGTQAFGNPLGHSLFDESATDPLSFNAWIVGAPLRLPPEKEQGDFDRLLAAVCAAIRQYNSTLYWLRRLHFHANAPEGSIPPEPNPNGPLAERAYPAGKPLPPADSDTFVILVQEAVAGWKSASDNLRAHLEPDSGLPVTGPFHRIVADMVEVNGYIASVRLVASPLPSATSTSQNSSISGSSGSSSSHVSLSSGASWP